MKGEKKKGEKKKAEMQVVVNTMPSFHLMVVPVTLVVSSSTNAKVLVSFVS